MKSVPETIPVVVITGPVGAGKSTAASELCDHLAENAIRTAMVDMDYLRWLHPAHPGDRFSEQIGLQNLAAIWSNLLAAGTACVVIADVVECMTQRTSYESAMPGSVVTIVRLDVPLDLIYARLQLRETAESLEWHQRRAPELQAIMEREAIGDLVISTGERSPEAVAAEIATRLHLIG